MTKAESAASRTPKLGKAHIEAIRRQWDQDLYPCSAEFYALCNMALQAADKDALLREGAKKADEFMDPEYVHNIVDGIRALSQKGADHE